MDVVLLHNEKAGDEDWSRKELLRLVRDAGFSPKYFDLKEALETPRVLRQGEFVIAAGGDGSIRQTALKLLGRGQPIAPLPLGTANNIARSLGLPNSPEKIVAGWAKRRHMAFDVGVVTGPWGRRRFIEGIGIGLISRTMHVLREIDDSSAHDWKKAKHRLQRDACVAAALAREMTPIATELNVDGGDASDDFLLLEILNICRAGPGLELAPKASPSDGAFDVVTVSATERRRLINSVADHLAEASRARSLATRRARQIRLATLLDSELRIDDTTVSLAAGVAVEVRVLPAALEFVLPG